MRKKSFVRLVLYKWENIHCRFLKPFYDANLHDKDCGVSHSTLFFFVEKTTRNSGRSLSKEAFKKFKEKHYGDDGGTFKLR